MRAILNPVELIAKRTTGTAGGRERLFEAYKNCKDIKEFTKYVMKEYHYFGCGSPRDETKPFPQLAGYSFMNGPNFKVDIYNKKRKEISLVFPISTLAETIWALIEEDNY